MLFLAEVYTNHPTTGVRGWEIEFVWVFAPTRQAARERVAKETPHFDEIIKMDEQCNIVALSGCTALVLSDHPKPVPAGWDKV